MTEKEPNNKKAYFGVLRNSRLGILFALISLLIVIGVLIFHFERAGAQEGVLYWGSRGNDVAKVQLRLRNWGYYDGGVDGIYGGKTWLAVREFQRRNGLRVDGVVGPNTWAALGFWPGLADGGTRPGSEAGTRALPVAARRISGGNDVYLLARLISGEARAEPFIGKVAVGAVVLNRVQSSAFPNTISGVIYQPFAFESVSNGQIWRPLAEDAVRAAQYAISGWDPTHGALFFWNPSKLVSPWIWTRNIITQIGRHVFAR